MADNETRVDKFLWAVRIFKTRNLAADACKKGKVKIKDYPIKPSRVIKSDDIIEVRKNPIVYTYKIIQPISNRVGAKLVEKYIENITPKSELSKLETIRIGGIIYDKNNKGRPTKKNRRDIDKLNN